MKYARDTLKPYFKSTNKVYQKEKPKYLQRGMKAIYSGEQQDASQKKYDEMTQLIVAASPQLLLQFPNLMAVAQAPELWWLGEIRATGSGNCSAYSILALAHIHVFHPEIHATRFTLVGGDHVFVVLNLQDQKCDTKPMNEWPDGATVCDPWANVVCRANKYYTCMESKLSDWADDGKLIVYKGQRVSPIDKGYLADMKKGQNRSDWKGLKPTKPAQLGL
jgi:hypothetical protein